MTKVSFINKFVYILIFVWQNDSNMLLAFRWQVKERIKLLESPGTSIERNWFHISFEKRVEFVLEINILLYGISFLR